MSQHEDFGRAVIRGIIGPPSPPWPTQKFTYSDIGSIKDLAIRNFINYQYRCRLPGMVVDLTDDDKRPLAYFEAAVEVLHRLGVIDWDRFKVVWQDPYSAVHEVLDEGVVGHTFTKQK